MLGSKQLNNKSQTAHSREIFECVQPSKCPKVNDFYTAGKAFSGGDQPESYSLTANIQNNPDDLSLAREGCKPWLTGRHFAQ